MMRFNLRMTIAARLLLWAALASALFYSAVGLGWYGLEMSRESLRTVHEQRLVSMRQTVNIERLLDRNRRLVLIAFQYDPEGKLSIAHDQALSVYLQEIRDNNGKIARQWAAFQVSEFDESERALLAAFEEHYELWREDLDAMLAMLEIGDFGASGMRVFLQVGALEGELASTTLVELRRYQEQKTAADFAMAEQRYLFTIAAYLALAVFGLIAGTLTGLLTLRRLRLGFKEVSASARAIAAGNLSKRKGIPGNDEITDLMADIVVMRDNLRQLIGQLMTKVSLLGQTSGQMSSLSEASSQLSQQQTDAVSAMSCEVTELSESIEQLRSYSESTRRITQQAANRAIDSEALIGKMVTEIDGISSAVTDTAGHMHSLEQSSIQIGSVISVINDLAEQTNLLSLNAAIEAARAGEMGRGFAVVASEVRQLADRTSTSTLEIAETVKRIQRVTTSAAASMQQSVGRVRTGVELANKASSTVVSIREGTSEVIVSVDEITRLLNSQSEATREIAGQVEGVSVGVGGISNSAAQTAGVAMELDDLAGQLESMTAQFSLAEHAEYQ